MIKDTDKYLAGFGLSFLVVSILSGLLTIAKDINPGLKDGMKTLTGHHWISHGLFVLLAFILLGLGLSLAKTGEDWPGERLATLVLGGTILGSLMLVVFYLFE